MIFNIVDKYYPILMPILRIITYDSPGLLNDATIYKNIFRRNHFHVLILKWGDEQKYYKKERFADVNLFLETIGLPNKIYDIKKIYPSKINLFMPNHELFTLNEKLKYIDFVLCKTRAAMEMFTHIKNNQKYLYECIYTKFTTFIPSEFRINDKQIKKNANLFVQFAGKSPYKNTDILVYTWIKYNGFLDIDPDIKLVITCYKSCYNKLIIGLKDKFNYDLLLENTLEHPDKYVYKNLVLYTSPATEYLELLQTANVAICISKKEGFGHYINEARYFGTYIITVDYPPMNELVSDGVNGKLIGNLSKNLNNYIAKHTGYQLYDVSPDIDSLAESIIYCIKNKTKLGQHTWENRKLFFSDMRYFENTINHFIDTKIMPRLKN